MAVARDRGRVLGRERRRGCRGGPPNRRYTRDAAAQRDERANLPAQGVKEIKDINREAHDESRGTSKCITTGYITGLAVTIMVKNGEDGCS